MRVSVIIPVFNGADRLATAVASVLPQIFNDDEIIIVDDGSTDATQDVISRFGPRVISVRQPNAGNAAARNAGLRLATGEAIAFLDHDDIWTPHRHKALVAALNADPMAGIALGRVNIVVEPKMPQPAADNPRYATVHRPWHLDAMLIRRDIFDRVGMFKETLRQAEDADWFMRVREAGIRFCRVDQDTVLYRLHTSNLTRNADEARCSLLQALKGGLDRRRSEK